MQFPHILFLPTFLELIKFLRFTWLAAVSFHMFHICLVCCLFAHVSLNAGRVCFFNFYVMMFGATLKKFQKSIFFYVVVKFYKLNVEESWRCLLSALTCAKGCLRLSVSSIRSKWKNAAVKIKIDDGNRYVIARKKEILSMWA